MRDVTTGPSVCRTQLTPVSGDSRTRAPVRKVPYETSSTAPRITDPPGGHVLATPSVEEGFYRQQ